MPIPDYQTLMLPLLKAVGDKKTHKISQLYDELSDQFGLTEEQRQERLPSGRETYIKNRVSWARTYLKKAGLVISPDKGDVKITQEGLKVLATNPEKIDNRYLRRFKGFVDFRPRNGDAASSATSPSSLLEDYVVESKSTPEENFDASFRDLREELASELLEEIKKASPYLFERLVIDLMLAMGYGGSRQDAGQATKRSADGGIDGVIKLDRLGLDNICLQAKRYNSEPIGEPKVRDFAGALQGVRAKKGVFITTSIFTQNAREYVEKIDSKIVLIDGKQLCKLLIDFNVAVSTKETYEVKQIDSDYFVEI